MKLLSEFLPIILFFVVFKLAGIYWATGAAIVAAGLQFLYAWIKNKQIDSMQLLTLATLFILGGATIGFHNELFIKWKPSIINWLFALLFIGSQFIGGKPIIQRLMEKNIQLSSNIWLRLNLSWAGFFIITGAINLYIAYHYPTEVWVNFKLFGLLGLTLFFVILQSLFLAKHMKEETNQ